MFIGKYEHILDSKGRICVPAKIRDTLRQNYQDEKLILTCYEKNYLVAYPFEEWLQIGQKIRDAPNTKDKEISDKKLNELKRILFSNASEVSFDRQGRILIPPEMRAKAGIDKEAVLVGVMNKIEIWARDKWLEFESKDHPDLAQLTSFGI
ncbi:MAG: division/cell wall cluster transcriptional repressor MraZ [bacterium]|nr:division/cell wall cluster transcriptional repressor MraZ [bacterium]